MKYYFEKPEIWENNIGKTENVKHPLFNRCTVFQINNKGIMVVQQKYNAVTKVKWWGPVDDWLASSIYFNSGFTDYFNKCATEKDENGLFYITTVRKIMWALKMKPLMKEYWENDP